MAKRTFRLMPTHDEYGDVVLPAREIAEEKIADLFGAIYQMGGMFSVAAHRQEVEEGRIETVAFIIEYDSHSPAQRLHKQTPEPKEAPEPKEGAEVATG